VIDTSTNKINSTGGIAFIGKIIEGIGFLNNFNLKHPALLKSTKLTPNEIEGRNYIPIDVDTSPIDNSKQCAHT